MTRLAGLLYPSSRANGKLAGQVNGRPALRAALQEQDWCASGSSVVLLRTPARQVVVPKLMGPSDADARANAEALRCMQVALLVGGEWGPDGYGTR